MVFIYIFLLALEDVLHVLLKYRDRFYINFKGERQNLISHVNRWTNDILSINSGLN